MEEEKNAPPAGGQEGQEKNTTFLNNYISDVGNFVNIPRELKSIDKCVCWKGELVDGKVKKIPIDPKTGRFADVSNPATWGSYKQAVNCFEGDRTKEICGIGHVLSENDPYVVIDLDHCFNPETKEPEPWVQEIVSAISSYTEISPSGNGLHIFVKGKNLFQKTRAHGKKIEIYDTSRFMTVTGKRYGEVETINERQQELEDALAPYFDTGGSHETAQQSEFQNKRPTECLSDDEIISKAMAAKNGDKFKRLMAGDLSDHRGDHSGGDMALCSMLAFWTENPDHIDRIFRTSKLVRFDKWDQKHRADGATYGQMTIEKAMEFKHKDCVKSEQSEFDYEDESVPERPVLDEKALHGFAGRFVELATRDSEADPAAVLATFLVRFGVEVGSEIVFMVGDTRHYARVFVVIVGETAKARKGTSAGPVESLFAFSAVRNSPGPLSTGEGLIAAVQDSAKNDCNYNEKQTVDSTNKRLFVLDQEFAAALSCTKREGNTLSTIIRSLWDTGNSDPLTKSSKISATNAHIGIVTHITLNELNLKMQDVEAFNGFANRFLWVYARREKKVPLPSPMPKDEVDELQNEIKSILTKASKFNIIKFSDDSKGYWKEIYDELSESRPGLVGSITGRSEAQVIRLSIMYCLLDGSDTVQVVHIEAALAFWDYCEKSATLIFQDRESDSTLQRIVDFLKTGFKSRTEINNHFSKHKRKSELDTALNELQRRSIISVEKIETAGANKTIYKLVPH